MQSWVDHRAVTDRRKQEAMILIRKLGHRTPEWLWVDREVGGDRWQTRCFECDQVAMVRKPSVGRADVSGSLVALRCPGRR